MLKVNKAKTHVAEDASALVVVIDGDDFEELASPDASALALREAATHGFTNVALQPDARPFAVDADTDEAVEPPFTGRPTNGYRVELTLVKRF